MVHNTTCKVPYEKWCSECKELQPYKCLRQYPDIKTITRDRGDCYIQAISEALPHVIQIADLFHLIVNYSDHVRNTVKKIISELKIRIVVKNPDNMGNENIVIQKIIDLTVSFLLFRLMKVSVL
ncbi:MAG: transposase [Proteiniphilum sp.]|nr:transposase [Proteiniphilum sp.]